MLFTSDLGKRIRCLNSDSGRSGGGQAGLGGDLQRTSQKALSSVPV
jgi:hypothetical protein